MIRRRRARALCAVAVCVATGVAALAACSSDADVAPPTTPAPTPIPTEPRADDGVLRVGVLLPTSGAGASIGVSQLAAVKVAIEEARAAGGVNGKNVELIVRDEGADAAAASVALQQLMRAQVDVIIGPAASNTAIALAPTIVQANIPACSPSASALALDDFPDDDLLFRTIASDRLQAEAMAEVIEQTGETSASIVYVDDGYGRPFEQVLEGALRQRGIEIDDAVGYATDDSSLESQAERAVRGNGAVALIGDPETGTRMLAAIAAEMDDTPRDVVVNDALRQPFSIGLLATISDDMREHIVGVSPYVRSDDEALTNAVITEDPTASTLFATQAYDCATLFMLAAEKEDSTQADVLKNVIPAISSAGSACRTFTECKPLLAELRRINYVGPSGRLALSSTGDPASAIFDQFNFDESGRDTSQRAIEASDNP